MDNSNTFSGQGGLIYFCGCLLGSFSGVVKWASLISHKVLNVKSMFPSADENQRLTNINLEEKHFKVSFKISYMLEATLLFI